MPNDAQDDFRRYARLVSAAIPSSCTFAPTAETGWTVQVERGIVFPACLRDPRDPEAAGPVDRLIDVARSPNLSAVEVVDRLGHRRPAYRPVLVYAWLQAFRLAYEVLPRLEFGRWEEGLRPWCDVLEADLTDIQFAGPTGLADTPASRGAAATQAAWTALALFVAGKVFVRDAWTDLASDTFGRLTRGQTDSGAMLLACPADNPETHWYHELVLLHALASYAVQAEDRPAAAAVARATAWHAAETQADHATGEPWALFAFVWNPDTRPTADGLLSAAGMLPDGARAGLASILLADALYCLQLFG